MLGDGTSISVGTINGGHLRHGRALAAKGEGYVIPSLWTTRGNRYGTDEIVHAIERAARRVRREYPGGTLGIGDLSPRGGGDSQLHRSHENGRDADLIYFAVDDQDKPVLPVDAMPRYSPVDLRSFAPLADARVHFGPFSPRRFDVKRNWALVRALLQDPGIEVQFLFCHEGLKARLIDYARSIGEDSALIDEASVILRQPGDSLPHDDHLHLRIYCSTADRAWGCSDRGPPRWLKKRWKYLPEGGEAERQIAMADVVARMVTSPFPGMRRLIP